MHVTKKAILLGCFWALTGCGRAPKVVFVDLSQVPLGAPTVPAGRVSVSGAAPASSSSLPAAKADSIFFGISEERFLSAVRDVTRNGQKSSQQLFRQLVSAMNAEVDDLAHKTEAVLDAESQSEMDAAVASTREVFEKYADQVGALQFELANLVGFPNQTPPPANPDDVIAMTRIKRAEEIRAELKDIEGQYLMERAALFQLALDKVRAKRAQANEELDQYRLKRLGEIAASIQQLLTQSSVPEISKTMQQLRVDVPGQDAVRSDLGRRSMESKAMEFQGQPSYEKQALQSELETWCAFNGYKLSDQKGVGVDLTQEFIQWRETVRSGP